MMEKTMKIELPVDGDRQPPWLIALLTFAAVFTICFVPGIVVANLRGGGNAKVTVSPSPQPSPPESSPAIERATLAPSPESTSPSRTPARTRRATPKTSPSDTPSVYFSSCAAVRAAGAVPLRRGDPGYRSALDRDGNGIACDS